MPCAEEVKDSVLHWGKCKVWNKPGSVIIIRLLEIEREIYYGLCSLSCYLHHTRMFTLLGSGFISCLLREKILTGNVKQIYLKSEC